jgi:predicted transcriptional regulator of viral defense system
MKYDDFFRKHPVFTIAEFSSYLSSYGDVRKRAEESYLAYYQKTGKVIRIQRGLYAVIPPGTDPDAYPVDPFLIAGKLTPDAVISHHSALEFHGYAYSIRELFTYLTSHPIKSLRFRSHTFRGTKFPVALFRAGKEKYGVIRADRAGMDIQVTGLERTLVDVLDRPQLSGSWEEIWRSLGSVEFFDLDMVIEYAHLLGNATTGAKVGYLLQQRRESLMVEEHHLNKLRSLRPRQPHYLDRTKRQSGRFIPEWNLIVPQEVYEQAWGDVV